MRMQLNHEHQLMLLKDILSEQQSECCGTISEYEQLERLIQSLLANDAIHDHLKQSLKNIYQYSQKGKNSRDSAQHITEYDQHITNWIEDLNMFS